MSGCDNHYMPDLAFRLMSYVFLIRDVLLPVGRRLARIGIETGFVVIDFGCGPGSYVEQASKLVGVTGKVYAVDIHPLAIKAINEKVKAKEIENVFPVLSSGYPVDIKSHSADIVYGLDMFHHIKDPKSFLRELHRLLKPGGTLYIESGHQKLTNARHKIEKSGFWNIKKQQRNMFVCIPVDVK